LRRKGERGNRKNRLSDGTGKKKREKGDSNEEGRGLPFRRPSKRGGGEAKLNKVVRKEEEKTIPIFEGGLVRGGGKKEI